MTSDGETLWTIDELRARAAEALSAGGYEGVDNGRVRDVPDARTIRYYATLGLIDRPQGFRGRTALYGPRHLLQVVAIKRLQARGRSLAEVQRMTTGATDALLAEIAGAELGTAPAPSGRARPLRPEGFWKERPAAPGPPVPREAVVALQAVRLGDDATLLLSAARPPDDDDLRVVRLAAAPLLELLRMRGLIGPPETDDAPNR